jgi:hypothetical protein
MTAKVWAVTLIIMAVLSVPAWSRDLLTDKNGDAVLAFKSSLVGSWQVSPVSGSDDATAGAAAFWRLRLEPIWKPGTDISLSAAWDSSSLLQNNTSATTLLPSFAPRFYRIWPLGYSTGQGALLSQQFLDRAWIAYQPSGGSIILGRQVLGWGRGTFFSAVDIFAPFSPLELDREWRPGVDALQGDVHVSDQVSVGGVIAPGNDPLIPGSPVDWNDSTFAARVHGTFGSLDSELIAGRRGQDRMLGYTGSLPVGDAEVHAEAAVFLTPGDIPDDGMFGNRDLVPKFILGGSNHFAWGSGVDASLEYHYSGFGVRDLSSLPDRLADPDFQKRYLRGDTQILGKQALSVQLVYKLTDLVTISGHLLESLVDSSGVLAPAVEWNFAEGVTLVGSGVWAYGTPNDAGRPQSQFGGTPTTWIVQIRVYD